MKKYHIIRRDSISRTKKTVIYIVAIFVSLLLCSLILLSLGVNPIKFYSKMVTIGIPESRFPFKQVEGLIKVFVPLLITSSALSLAFRMKFWNCGGEGQFIMGAFAASTVGILCGPHLSQWLTLLLMSIAALLAGGIFGLIPAFLKVRFGTNETLMTLMFNYIALYFITFFAETSGAWNFYLDPKSPRPTFIDFSSIVSMPSLQIGKFKLNIGLIIALVICVLLYFYLNNTKHGYEISVVGDSIDTARYAGMKVKKIILRTMFLSSCFIGLAGCFTAATAGCLSTSITNGVGWTGIIVAWLAKFNPIGIVLASLLISVLRFGCSTASSGFASVDSHFADLLQGIILFTVLAAEFIIRFKIAKREDK